MRKMKVSIPFPAWLPVLLLALWTSGTAAASGAWPRHPAAQAWPVNQPREPAPEQGYRSGYRYRPLQQRPGLPPNSSGDPGVTTYGYSTRTPDGGYSYSYRIRRRGGSGYPQQFAAEAPPRVEATLSERRPLVQQNLIYRIRIHGSGNLREAAPELPRTEALVFRQLGKPVTYTGSDGRLVTEYTYLVIPLEAGSIQLPPPRVTGRYTSGQPFDATGSHGLTLHVQPAQEGVVPWLPLYDLQLEAHLPDLGRARAGEPLTLEIVTTAIGAVGSQLPSVAGQLESEDFYIYPGEVTVDGRVSGDGLDLLGSRIERFTLVPRYGGRLTLPAMSLSWWNLRTGRPATASLPMRRFEVAGPVGEKLRSRNGGTAHSLYFWIPLALALALLLAGWLKVLFGRGGRLPQQWRPGSPAPLLRPLAGLLARLSPRRHLHRLRSWIGRRLPVSWKLWYCLRAVDRERDPEAWEHALQLLAHKHLGARANAGPAELADAITGCHPAADAARVRQLLKALETHNYGGRPIDDFDAWKRDFQRQIRPTLLSFRFRRCTSAPRERTRLPRLNPGS